MPQAPILQTNRLFVEQGQLIKINSSHLKAADPDTSTGTLQFMVSDVQHGWFELTSSPYATITSFTQQQVINGNVVFRHDNSNIAPSYRVSVSDGTTATVPTAADTAITKLWPQGLEFQVNTYTPFEQSGPAVLGLADGGYLIAWTSQYQDGSSYGIFAQRYDANNKAIGNEFQVNTYTSNTQSTPYLLGLTEGFLIIWISDGQDGSGYGIYAQRYDVNVNRVGEEFRVNTYTTNAQYEVNTAVFPNGDYLIAWTSTGQDGSAEGVYAQRYAANGSPLGSEFKINTITAGLQRRPAIGVFADGSFLVVWVAWDSNDSSYFLTGQYFLANGNRLGNEFVVADRYSVVPLAQIAVLANGSYVVAWQSSGEVTAKQYNAFGNLVGTRFTVDVYLPNGLDITVLADGGYLIAWNNKGRDGINYYYRVYAQRYDAYSNPIGSTFRVNSYTSSDQYAVSLAKLTNGDVIMAWQSDSQDMSGYGVSAQHFAIQTSPQQLDIRPQFPVLTANRLFVEQGQLITINSSHLSAADPDTSADTLQFMVSEVQHGRFEFTSNPNVAIASFTQQQVTSGKVVFRHDNSNIAPSYRVSVSDGTTATVPASGDTTITKLWRQGLEFQVNTYTPFEQSGPTVLGLADGGYLIAWTSQYQDGSSYGIFAQRYDANNKAIGSEFQVNTYTSNTQSTPYLLGLTEGFLIIWISDGQDGSGYGIYAQRYDANVNRVGEEFRVNTYTTDAQYEVNTAVFPNGDYLIAWTSTGQDGSAEGVYAQRYAANGSPLGSEFKINTSTAGSQRRPAIGVFADGSFVVVWGTGTSFSFSLTGQYFLANGNRLGSEFVVDDGYSGAPLTQIAVLANGSYIVTCGINIKQYNAFGNLVGTEFSVNPYVNSELDIAVLADGGYLIAWGSNSQDGSGYGVYARRFDAYGKMIGSEFRVNSYTALDQKAVSLAKLANGDVIMAWQSDSQDGSSYGIYAQRFAIQTSPQLVANQLLIEEQQTITLNTTHLSGRSIPAGKTLTFTASDIQHGYFAFRNDTSKAITSFTQQQIDAAEVCFIHDGKEVAPSYRMSLSDGYFSTGNSTAAITFKAVNDRPELLTNRLTLQEGQSVILSSDNLSAVDVDSPADTLTFMVSEIQYGQFERVNAPGSAITQFTQQDITNQQIRFVHDGSYFAPSYRVLVSDGLLSSAAAFADIIFHHVNIAPALAATSTPISYTEGSGALLVDANITLVDSDSLTLANATVSISANFVSGEDSLGFTAQRGITGLYDSTTGVLSLSGTAPVAEYQTVLRSVTYQNLSQNPSTALRSISFVVNDGFIDSNKATRDIAVATVNNAPTLINNQITLSQDQTITLTSAQLSATDVDNSAGSLVFIVSDVQYGEFKRNGTPVTRFTQQDIANGMVEFVHTGSVNAPSYSVTVSDGMSTTSAQVAIVTFNQKPVLVMNTTSLSYTEGDSATVIDSGLTLSDVDTATMVGATISITGNFNGNEDVLGFVNQNGISGSYNSTTGILTLTGTVSAAHYQTALRSVTYLNNSDNPSTAARTISFTVNDGITDSNPATYNIGVIGVNDAPILAASNGSSSCVEGIACLIDSGITITDIDSAILSGATVSITNNFVSGEDRLTFTNQNGITGSYNSATGELTLTGASSLAHYQAALRSVLYRNLSQNPSTAARIISIQVNDGSLVSNTVTRTLNILAVNNAPTVTTSSGVGYFTEGDAPVVIDNNISLTDVDSTYLARATISISNGYRATEDVLAFTNQNGITGSYNSATGVLTLTGSASVEHYQAALRSVTYRNTSPNPTTTARTISVQINDGIANSNTATRLLNVIAVNNAPVITTNQLSIGQGQTVIFTPAQLSASDVDTPADVLQFTVSQVQYGEFLRDGVTVTSFTQQDIIDGNISFVHDGSINAPSYSVIVSDGMASANPETATVDFNLTPSLINNQLSVSQGQTVTLTLEQLSVFDDTAAADSLQFMIDELQHGQFKLNGLEAMSFSLQHIMEGKISFTHDGTNSAPSYRVAVSDGITSSAPQLVSINFDAIPVLANNNLNVGQGQTVILTANQLSAVDDNTPADALQFDVSNLQHGQFKLNGVNTTSFSQQDILDGKVTFVHDDTTEAPSYSITVSDGTLSSTAQAAAIAFNGTPVLITNQLNIAQGQTVVITTSQLNVSDVSSPAALQLSVSDVQHGQFKLDDSNAVSFSLQDIIEGKITFTHDGSILAPSYRIAVTDGTTSTIAQTASISFNPTPVLVTNSLTVGQGQTIIISATELSATDVDNAGGSLQFSVSDVQHGQFKLNGLRATSFTQQDITDGEVVFAHDGSTVAPSYQVSVSDGTTSTVAQAASISFNQTPVLVNNQLAMGQGQSVTLTTAQLSANDDKTAAAALQFTISNVQHGQFKLNGVNTNSFTQQDITDGKVAFVQDGSASAPSYGVSVSDGSLSSQVQTASINFNALPVLTQNSLTIAQGQTVTLTTSELNASDDATTALVFTVSNVQHGQFKVNGNTTTSFSLQDMSVGKITFVHDGSAFAPSYSISVSDGVLSSALQAAGVSFNPTPVLVHNQLAIGQGQSVTLTASHLSASDDTAAASAIVFTVTNVQQGEFRVNGVSATSFTQQDINAGKVSFVQDGEALAPSYQVSVSDGVTSSTAQTASINFNVAPVLGNNQLDVSQGQAVILTAAYLSASDSDNASGSLQFTVSEVQHGQFTLSGVNATRFSQQNITDSQVVFSHDGSTSAPSYKVSVSDGALSCAVQAASISFNQTPVLVNNQLSVAQGQTVTLTTTQLSATDVESAANTLTFSVSQVQHGEFKRNGVAVTQFTQQDITEGSISFKQDGSASAPSYSVVVSDGRLTSHAQAANISFNRTPVLVNNQLAVGQGQAVILTVSHLSASDDLTASGDLQFIVSNVQYGEFQIDGTAVTQFTQQDILDGNVTFMHDGSASAPNYHVSVSDGTTTTSAQAATVAFNQRPALINNQLSVAQGQSVTLTLSHLSASDDTTAAGSLEFTVSEVKYGQFKLNDVTANCFTQQDIIDGKISFVHDGTAIAPSYSVTVSDGAISSVAQAASISFNQTPVLVNNRLTVNQGQTVVLTAAQLRASDADTPAEALEFRVSQVQHGQFKLASIATTSFTQQNVTDSQVTFEHDDSLDAPSYNVTVSDGVTSSMPQLALVSFDAKPVIVNNNLSIGQGQMVTLTAAQLSATDDTATATAIVFSVSNVQYGEFQLNGLVVTRFTQQDINEGKITFVQDGSTNPPSYRVSVSDGVTHTAPEAAHIVFRRIPMLTTSTIPGNYTEGEAPTAVDAGLAISAPDVTDLVRATVRITTNFSPTEDELSFSNQWGIAGEYDNTTGVLHLIGHALVADYQTALRRVLYRTTSQTPSTASRTVSFEVDDGLLSSEPVARTLAVRAVDNAPVLLNNRLTVTEGQRVVLTPAMLQASDVDTTDSQLWFIVSQVKHGQFERVGQPGQAITSFSQAEVAQGDIQFVHDGSKAAPRYLVAVSDGTTTLPAAAATVQFITVNHAPVLKKALAEQTVEVNQPFSFKVPADMFEDADGDSLSLAALTQDGQALPDWITFDAQQQAFSGKAVSVGNSSFSLFARDPSHAMARTDFNVVAKDSPNALTPGAQIGIGVGVGAAALAAVGLGAAGVISVGTALACRLFKAKAAHKPAAKQSEFVDIELGSPAKSAL